ncbi:WG repeat-containing protein [Flavobacterium sp.]|uniref:WG repeat-containing protein n=1 Tax=Flavobacterium sp. TaxID=239 RepID=UPI00391BF9A2
MKLKYTFLCLLCTTTLLAQKKLNYNHKGELSKQEYQKLLAAKKYQALSAFDTVSTKPLLVYAIFLKNNKFGIIDDTAKEITPAIYDGIEGMNISYTTVMFGFHENFPVKIGKKYGLISNKGKSILPVEYDYIYCEQKRSVKRKHKKEVVIDSVVVADKGNEKYFFSPQGKLLKKIVEEPNQSQETVEEYREYNYPSRAYTEKNTTPKETTSHGNIIKKLDNGYVIVEAKVENKYYYQGLVELASNKLVLPVVHSSLIVSQKDRLIAVKDKKYNLYNTKGELILKETYEGIESFNKIYRIKKEGKTAIFDLDLNQKTDFIYDYFSSSGPDFMVAKKGEAYGVIDTYGNETIPFIYNGIEAYFNRYGSGMAFFKVIKRNKQGIISTKGEPLTEIIYDEIIPECTIDEPSFHSEPTMPIDHDYDEKNNQFFIIKKDNLFGLLDNSFKPLIPIEHDILKKSFHKDFVITGKKATNRNSPTLSLLKIKNNTAILPYEYDYFKYLGGTYFMIYQKSLMGVCDFEGKLIIPMGNCRDLSDRYYFNYIYYGLNKIDGRKSNYIIDYQGTMIDLSNK